ncbi:MAG: biotin--[acetyl-CoA-carboxylase] ligase, partial [Planctomycetia bacterium]|nr:biotin--[acetyl-CoA-carboxylase] ligase [Planctomycetia bacterium]
MALDEQQLALLSAETFVRTVEQHAEISSTSDRAIALAGSADVELPLLVLADRQTAGRGRGANRWWAGPGALTFSLLLDGATLGLAPHRWPQVSLATALAVGELLCDLVPPPLVRLKWPNDVFLDGRKVCGILVESPAAASGRLVIGLGLNVNNSTADAPPELRQSAVALCEIAGREVPPIDVLSPLLARIETQLARLTAADPELPDSWRPFCLLHGRSVQLQDHHEITTGVCQGIDADGALLLATSEGTRRFLSGTIVRFQ